MNGGIDKMKKPNFEKEIQVLSHKMEDNNYAVAFYRALCNMRWKKLGTDYIYSCSWIDAGGLVASMRYKGEDYLHFYCSGGEGKIRKDIEEDLNNLEYIPVPYDEIIENNKEDLVMPYIEEKDRKKFDAALEHAAKNVFKKGELTYCIYKLGVEVMKDLNVNYENLTLIRSAMMDAADEWWDEKVKPYERKKKRENGDVV